MIMVELPFLHIEAWIFRGQWMWHLMASNRVLRWSRLKGFAEEYMFFTYCAIGERG